ncbi:hypothetical protein BDB00DRAFT_849609 [Zychaea mexicana]|uniref:uncharacterized protein n=1 Tax=Zychaea mexicana TaxID=64656 RepID=UPI0022FEC723|nr:uncharacterized protein BDB00DRAFT_849609 [Zychaea mexicana]KAI9488179.1 hypothetical protein BDB00DRAFT_849609 [Zychaea mexicana]
MTYYFTRFSMASRSFLSSLCILSEIVHPGAHNRIILPIDTLPFMKNYTHVETYCGLIPPMLQ